MQAVLTGGLNPRYRHGYPVLTTYPRKKKNDDNYGILWIVYPIPSLPLSIFWPCCQNAVHKAFGHNTFFFVLLPLVNFTLGLLMLKPELNRNGQAASYVPFVSL